MSGSFYEVLGVGPDASADDIRKAYKKRALQTHPDRLPPGATTKDKQTAEEQFRKVNNAYEILSDQKNRKLYDLYGVWPPPEDNPEEIRRDHAHRSGYRPSHTPSDPFNDRFFGGFPTSPFGDPFAPPHPSARFRDPFDLFNSMFAEIAEMERSMHHAHGPMFGHHPFDPFARGPNVMFDRGHSLLRPAAFSPFPSFPAFPQIPTFPDDRRGSSFRTTREYYGATSGGADPEWSSQSRMTRTINGTTQTIWKRRDHHGNEHITYIYPDGREEYTVNGVEQPSPTAYIQNAPPVSRVSHPEDSRSSLPIIPPDYGEGSSKRHWWSRR